MKVGSFCIKSLMKFKLNLRAPRCLAASPVVSFIRRILSLSIAPSTYSFFVLSFFNSVIIAGEKGEVILKLLFPKIRV